MTPAEQRESMMIEKRFDRIETKIDQLVSVVTTLARVEEQMSANNKRLDLVQMRLNKVETDLDGVAELARNNSVIAKFADKIFWLLVTAMISLAVFFIQSIITNPIG